MNFLEQIISLDKEIFLFFNGQYSSWGDCFWWNFTHLKTWIPALVILVIYTINKLRKESIFVFLGIILTILLADQIASGILKPLVERLRPTHDPTIKNLVHIVNNYRGGLYGFVSSHASNTFGLATLFCLLFKHRFFRFTIISWATLTAYSRIYLGVHFPLDILCGAIVGIISAMISYFLLKRFRPQVFCYDQSESNQYLKYINLNVVSFSFFIIGTIIALM